MSGQSDNQSQGHGFYNRRNGLLWTDNEDESAELEFTLNTLLGIRIIAVKSFDEADKILREKQISIVLSDVKVNYARPWKLCQEIKSNDQFRHIPVIMLLDKEDKKNRTSALDMGADDFILRPFDNSDIYNRIRAQLRIYDLHTMVVNSEREKVMLEMAGAAAHELAQPITSAMGLIQIILAKNEMNEQKMEYGQEMKMLYECLQRMTDVIHKIQRIRKYETTPYAGAKSIIDITKASS